MKPVLDALVRTAYRGAYRMMRVYWAVRQPDTHGALVAIWHDGRILLVRNSYVPYYSLPGGYVRRGESAKEAAVRELEEEVGIEVSPEQLEPSVDLTHRWEKKNDHVEIFALDVDERPDITVDNREVIAAEWFTGEEALAQDLFPPIFKHVVQRLS